MVLQMPILGYDHYGCYGHNWHFGHSWRYDQLPVDKYQLPGFYIEYNSKSISLKQVRAALCRVLQPTLPFSEKKKTKNQLH